MHETLNKCHILLLQQHDYQTFISRKADKRQSLIVSLSDHYHQQLKDIDQEKEELIRDYDEKKTGTTVELSLVAMPNRQIQTFQLSLTP